MTDQTKDCEACYGTGNEPRMHAVQPGSRIPVPAVSGLRRDRQGAEIPSFRARQRIGENSRLPSLRSPLVRIWLAGSECGPPMPAAERVPRS
jgi:hypothetical protein